MTGSQAKELIAVRKSLGMDDKRANWKECELCDNAGFQPGTVCSIPAAAPSGTPPRLDTDAENLVQILTDQILSQLK
jgi:L-fuculose-phosphate aldolase